MSPDKPSVDGLMALVEAFGQACRHRGILQAKDKPSATVALEIFETAGQVRAYASRLAQPQGELVAYRFDWPAEAGVGMRRFAGADDPFVEQQRKWGVAKIVPLYTEPPQSADRQDFDRRLALQKASYEREIAIEAAADRELLEQALEALESCSEGGYRDIDGDWCERLHYDKSKVAAALAAIREHLKGEP
jgi:hypothetical protein